MKFYKSMKSLQNILWKWRDSHVPDPSRDDIIEAGIQPCPCDQDPQIHRLVKRWKRRNHIPEIRDAKISGNCQRGHGKPFGDNSPFINHLNYVSTHSGPGVLALDNKAPLRISGGKNKSSTSHIVHCHKS